jgi:hypothetical protein
MPPDNFQHLQFLQDNQLRIQQQEQQRHWQQQQMQMHLQQRQSQQQSAWNQQWAETKRRQKSAVPLRGAGWLPETGDIAADPPSQGAPQAEAGRIVGVARAVNQRFEQSVLHRQNQLTVWTFRVERHDDEGRALPPVPVEIRGLNFKGVVSEGDWVDVGRSWRPGTVLHAKNVRNLTTGDRLHVTGRGPRAVGALFALVLFAAFCTFAALLVLGKIHP